MAFKVKQCRGVNARTGEPCRQPSLKGKEYCRFHIQAGEADQGQGAKMHKDVESERVDDTCVSTADDRDVPGTVPSPTEDLHAPSSGRKPKRGAKLGNRNARRHGLFSTRMPFDEKELYEENKRLFAEQAGVANAFDELVVHLLALVAAKLDVAAANGAAPQSIIPLSNEVLRLLRSLKETRDSRDEEDAGAPKTFADFLAEAEALAQARGMPVAEDETKGRVLELEREVNELRRQLNLPQIEDGGHRKTACARCGAPTSQRLNLAGEWVCLACGVTASPARASAGAPASGPVAAVAKAASPPVPSSAPTPPSASAEEPKPSAGFSTSAWHPRNE